MLRASKVSSIALLAGFAALTGCTHPDEGSTSGAAPLASQAVQAAKAAAGADANIDRHPEGPAPRAREPGALTSRAAAVASAHAPLLQKLQATKARSAKSFVLVNAFATTLSPAEVDTLSADATVLAVVPDRVMKLPTLSRDDLGATTGGRGTSRAAAATDGCATPSSPRPSSSPMRPSSIRPPRKRRRSSTAPGKKSRGRGSRSASSPTASTRRWPASSAPTGPMWSSTTRTSRATRRARPRPARRCSGRKLHRGAGHAARHRARLRHQQVRQRGAPAPVAVQHPRSRRRAGCFARGREGLQQRRADQRVGLRPGHRVRGHPRQGRHPQRVVRRQQLPRQRHRRDLARQRRRRRRGRHGGRQLR